MRSMPNAARTVQPQRSSFRVIVVGGGNAGISVAARLQRAGVRDIAVIEPSASHYYQPLWTLVGGGLVDVRKTIRLEKSVMPRGVTWVRDRCVGVDPDAHRVSTAESGSFEYDHLVLAPGIQLDWDSTPGMTTALESPVVSSNYDVSLAPKTWEVMRELRGGTALFTMPSGPVKCPGAPQKIAYLCADYWRRIGVLHDVRVVLALPGGGLFGIPVFAKALAKAVDRYGIEVHFNTEAVAFDGPAQQATLLDASTGVKSVVNYDALHLVPKQSAPDWLKHSLLADPSTEYGFADVDKHTLQHVRYPSIFALGDAGNTPNSKTGAAIRKQAPVVVANLLASLAGQQPSTRYDGYAACPFTTARNKVLLAEFDYSLTHRPTLPFIDTARERYIAWLIKRYGLPAAYWHVFLRGLA
jgi:sulfide:quinone oxidoreductase